MVQLADLSDDCLMEVLDRLPAEQLFKVQRLNKRINCLATIKMQVNIQAISVSVNIWFSNKPFFKCSHLNAISPEALFLNSKFENFSDLPTKAFFSSILSKCASVKCIEFGCFQVPGDLLLEMFRRCPQLECLVFEKPIFKVDEWERVLDQFGNRIVHFGLRCHGFTSLEEQIRADARIIGLLAAKCANIKRVAVTIDWFLNLTLIRGLWAAFKLLPNSCWIAFQNDFVRRQGPFEDVVDELNVLFFDCLVPVLKNRIERLSILKTRVLQVDGPDSPVRGIVFAGLKKLVIIDCINQNQVMANLLASQFPRLEEFSFNPNGLTEDVYDKLFQKMATVKMLTILCGYESGSNPVQIQLPQSAIFQLKNLKSIDLKISKISINFHMKEFIEQIELYVDEVGSLKKLTVEVDTHSFLWREKKLKKKLRSEIIRLSLKQNRVEVDLLKID